MPDYARVAAGAVRGLGAAASVRRPADDPFFVDLGATFDGINIDKPGRPGVGLGNQGGGKDDLAGYNTHAFVLQVPEARGHARRKPVNSARPRTRSSACGRRPSAAASRVRRHAPAGARARTRGAGQPPRQPADQRGDHPARAEGQVQPDAPADDAENFGTFAAQPASRPGS